MQRVSCIDIGTVTARLAVADVEGGRVQRLIKQSTIVDVGEGLTATGRICEAAQTRLLNCVDGYLAAARQAKAPVMCCTMTSAARDASNSEQVVSQLAARGLTAQVIPGEVEGMLTFLGISQDFPGKPILIADNGGGSTELALGQMVDGVIDLALVKSVDVGCRRITERFLSEREDGVPSEQGLAAAHRFAQELFAPVAERIRTARMAPDRLLVCGGTVTTLFAIEAELDPYDSSRVHLHDLTLEQVEQLEARLAAMTVDQRAQLKGIQPKRARVILGGTVAIAELMKATGFDRLTVSESDLLFGLALTVAAAVAGDKSPVGWVPSLTSLG
ncbi:MAG: phosphatase [Coriobacteriales bacterium]|nr:phosphatase [Coriobacteriales bacterium]